MKAGRSVLYKVKHSVGMQLLPWEQMNFMKRQDYFFAAMRVKQWFALDDMNLTYKIFQFQFHLLLNPHGKTTDFLQFHYDYESINEFNLK